MEENYENDIINIGKSRSIVEAKTKVRELIESWNVSYQIYVEGDESFTNIVHVTFSKPLINRPAPSAYVKMTFYLDHSVKKIISYKFENELHKYELADNIKFDERLLDRIITRKIQLRNKNIINLRDDYIETRVPIEESIVSDLKIENNKKKIQSNESFIPIDTIKNNMTAEEEQEETLALENYLIQLFKDADKSNNGTLDYIEFRDLLLGAKLNIKRADVDTLFSFVDENEDGDIEYQEFIPVAVEMITNFKKNNQERDMDNEKIIQEKKEFIEADKLETVETVAILRQLLQAADYQPPTPLDKRTVQQNSFTRQRSMSNMSLLSGTLPRNIFRECLNAPIAHLTKEEINMIVALSCSSSTNNNQLQMNTNMSNTLNGRVSYINFEELLHEARYRIRKEQCSGGMLDNLEEYMLDHFIQYENNLLSNNDDDTSNIFNDNENGNNMETSGKMSKKALVVVLQSMRKLLLSKFQVYSLVADAEFDENDYIEYRDFIPVAAKKIRQMFDPVQIKRKALLLKRSKIQPTDLLYENDKKNIEKKLYNEFQKHDRDHNGVLDIKEFETCLRSMKLNLDDKDIKELLVLADTNSDHVIDYEEFLRLSYSHLLYLAREKAIKELELNEKQ